MRMKLTKVLVLVMALVVPMALTTVVTAAPKDCPGHPSCKPDEPEEPIGGGTCAEAKEYFRNISHAEEQWTDQSFTVVLNNHDSACVDMPEIPDDPNAFMPSAAGTWTVRVTTGSARSVSVAVADSVASGGSCWRATVTGDHEVLPADLPASELDACTDTGEDRHPALTFHASYEGVRKLRDPVVITVCDPTETQGCDHPQGSIP